MRKKKYTAPAILADLRIEMEDRILASSSVVTDETEVVSTGQEVEVHDFTEGFKWE